MENEINQNVQNTESVKTESPAAETVQTVVEKSGNGKKKNKNVKIIVIIIAAILVIAGGIFAVLQLTKECEHEWKAATVSAPKTCAKCGETEGEALVAIPDIKNLDEATAKTLIAGKGFIPKIEYEYNDDTEEGQVIKTKPAIGAGATADDVVTVYISKGPKYIRSEHSTITWHNIGSGDDDWSFYAPYIEEGKLYIECSAKFSKNLHWKDTYNDGSGFGEACVTDVFDKTVPVVIKPENSMEFKAGKSNSFTIEIPLSDLDVSKPTTMSLKLIGEYSNKEQVNIRIDFTMNW